MRRQVRLPLRTTDGFRAQAEAITFDGLADGRDHLALALGAWREAVRRGRRAARRRWSGCTASASPATCSAASAATAGRSCARRSSGSARRRLRAVPAARGPGHRPVAQDRRLRPAGRRARHLRGERGSRARRGRARLRPRGRDARALGTRRVALLTNNLDKVRQLREHGVEVTEQVPTALHLTPANRRYLTAKARRGEHLLPGLAAG